MARLGDRLKQHAGSPGETTLNPFERKEAIYADIPLEAIHPDPNQPRKDLGDLSELEASIAVHGIVQPLVVSATGYNDYLLIAGERRYTAANRLGLKTVPAIVRTIEEHTRLEVQLIENIHRKDLNPLEEALSYKRLMEEFGLTQDALGKRLGKAQPTINLTLKLLDLPQEIQVDYLTSNNLISEVHPVSKSVLQEIARQPSPETQKALWEQAKQGDLTVKQARLQLKSSPSKVQRKPSLETTSIQHSVIENNNKMVHRIKTDGALITILFEKGLLSSSDILLVLEQALQLERERQTSLSPECPV